MSGNLLIAPVGMVMGGQDNPRAQDDGLGRGMGAHELPELLLLFN
jgi:hypothetical protein